MTYQLDLCPLVRRSPLTEMILSPLPSFILFYLLLAVQCTKFASKYGCHTPLREHDKRVASLKSRPLLESDELHWNRKNKNKNSKCGVSYVHAKYLHLRFTSDCSPGNQCPSRWCRLGAPLGQEVTTRQLLPQEDRRHVLVPSGPPRRDLIKTNETS